MDKLLFREVRSGDIEHVASQLRPADRDELIASAGPQVAPLDILARAVMNATQCWTATAQDHEPCMVFGVNPLDLLSGMGAPWALATERVFEYPGALVQSGRRYIATMSQHHPHLLNFVDARNTRSVRWLRRMGFRIHPAQPHGALRLPFHKFEIIASV